MGMFSSPKKGFLLSVGPNHLKDNLKSAFSTHAKFNDSTLYLDEGYTKNIYINANSSELIIYKGDRHFYKPFLKEPQLLASLPVEKLSGTIVTYSDDSKLLTLKTDFLGSEPLYYSIIEETLWLTDRIENFTRFFDFSQDLSGIYTLISIGASISSRTTLKGVSQTKELQTISYKVGGSLSSSISSAWKSEQNIDIEKTKQAIYERLYQVLSDAPNSSLMLSAGWDSRVLMCQPDYIQNTYTHGDLTSREIDIAFQLGNTLQVPMTFLPLMSSSFGAEANLKMLNANGQCMFPHWFTASDYLNKQAALPIASGMMVEHFSGHFGINVIPGTGRKTRTLKSFLSPDSYDRIQNDEAINFLVPHLSSGFSSLPWFFSDEIDFPTLKKSFTDDVENCLQSYVESGTSGIHELCERFKMLHLERFFMANQTKSASCFSGYHHPYIDGELAQHILQLKYRHRIGYKLSRSFVKKYRPDLLNAPLAATLVKAKAPLVAQETSRFIRILGEKAYRKALHKVPKGLGWNNFQFLNNRSSFHEIIDSLQNTIWDKKKMHRFVEAYTSSGKDGYSLVVMLGKIATVDFQVTSNKY